MRPSDCTLQERRERLRAIFTSSRGRRLHELIDLAVTASGADTRDGDETPVHFEFPAVRSGRVAV